MTPRKAALLIYALLSLFLLSPNTNAQENVSYPFVSEYSSSQSINGRIFPPPDFERVSLQSDSGYSAWIRHLPLKPKGSPVLTWRGDTLKTAESIVAVVDLDIPNQNYQCADVAMRLWAEYLWSQNRQDKIEFTSLAGVPLIWKGDKQQAFMKYLNKVMAYCNTSSMARDYKIVHPDSLLPGDMYIQPDPSGKGGIGHLSIIFDIAENYKGEKVYLFGYGFMPAQDLHILWPDEDEGIAEWFSLDGYEHYIRGFGTGQYHRFE